MPEFIPINGACQSSPCPNPPDFGALLTPPPPPNLKIRHPERVGKARRTDGERATTWLQSHRLCRTPYAVGVVPVVRVGPSAMVTNAERLRTVDGVQERGAGDIPHASQDLDCRPACDVALEGEVVQDDVA